MASVLKHLRSSTANKRPTASGLADGQIAINTASGTPALFFKDNADNIVKVGPVHVGATAPNASPAGSAGNSIGELWVDNSLTTQGLKYYSGSEFINLTPSGTTSTAGLVELATNAETQTGSDAVRAVTPAGLQSKVSDSTSTTSSTTIASATAVKSAYDLADAALPKSGGAVTGEIVISPSGSLAFEGSTDDSFETRIVVTNPTADRTITLPNTTGTVITTGDSGTVTSTMIANGTIVDADINASAAIAPSKLGSGALPNSVTVSSTNIVDGTIVDADVNASAAIAGTKISPDFGGQNVVTTGTSTAASFIPTSSTIPTNGVYLPAANSVALSTNGTGRLFVDASGRVGIGKTPDLTFDVLGRQFVGSLSPRVDESVTYQLQVQNAGNSVVKVQAGATSTSYLAFGTTSDALATSFAVNNSDGAIRVRTGDSERARIDSSGRLLVGTSTSSGLIRAAFQGNVGNATGASVVHLQRGEAAAAITADEILGVLRGTDNADNIGAEINFVADAGWGAADYPGRLVFSTTADGASSPTERLRITSTGNVGIGTTSPNRTLNVFASQEIAATFQSSSTSTARVSFRDANTTDDSRAAVGCAGNDLLLFANSVERARIDSSGRLLVGTSSSRSTSGLTPQVQIESTTKNGSSLGLFANINDASGPFLLLSKSRAGSIGGNVIVSSGDTLGNVRFVGNDGSANLAAAQITAQVDGTPGTNDMPGRLVFSTTPSGSATPVERMRITSEGYVYTGAVSLSFAANYQTNALNRFAPLGSTTANPAAESYTGSTTERFHFIFSNTNGIVGSISTSGTATAYNTSSDYRLKENVTPVTDGITRLQQLKPSRFNFIADPTKTVDGFLAHEVQTIVPEAITGEKDAVDEDGNPQYQGIDQSKIVPLVVAALQEAIAKIETLEQRLSDAGIN